MQFAKLKRKNQKKKTYLTLFIHEKMKKKTCKNPLW
jgi:hypothetical protein